MRIYTSANQIDITDIPDRFAGPSSYRAKLSLIHTRIVDYAQEHFNGSKKNKQLIVDCLNIATYCVISSEVPPFDWSQNDPLNTIPDTYDISEIEEALDSYCLSIDAIKWNIPIQGSSSNLNSSNKSTNIQTKFKQSNIPQSSKAYPTPSSYLWVSGPTYPRIDVNKPWLAFKDDYAEYKIYTTLPEIPECQSDVSVTTDMSKMTEPEFMNLYPNRFIPVREPHCYDRELDLDMPFDEQLGYILPIHGYTEDQVRDNIVKYPYIRNIKRVQENVTYGTQLVSFWKQIEIDGELVPIEAAWTSIPDSAHVGNDTQLVREYVIRKYLLDRDNGFQHKYPMYGTMDPFLVLFMPPEEYIKLGYDDTSKLARDCVRARINYNQSRNPIIRRMQELDE